MFRGEKLPWVMWFRDGMDCLVLWVCDNILLLTGWQFAQACLCFWAYAEDWSSHSISFNEVWGITPCSGFTVYVVILWFGWNDLYGSICGFRTLQTAVGVFGGEGYTSRMDMLPLMVANAANSSYAAFSSLNCPPIVAVELCRERLVCHFIIWTSFYVLT